ncbi:MAG: hypothetical protein Q8M56_11910 [Desulfobacterales bacterium]|nr:hypothetical protein [Desulfobacterales bacterium]
MPVTAYGSLCLLWYFDITVIFERRLNRNYLIKHLLLNRFGLMILKKTGIGRRQLKKPPFLLENDGVDNTKANHYYPEE